MPEHKEPTGTEKALTRLGVLAAFGIATWGGVTDNALVVIVGCFGALVAMWLIALVEPC